MNFFRRRAEKLVVVHALDPETVKAIVGAFDRRTLAIRYAARQDRHAREYAARVEAGMVHPKFSPPPPEDPEWAEWRTSPDAAAIDELEIEDLLHARRVLQGVEKVDEEARQRAIRHYAAGVEAYGLPRVEARRG